MRKPKLITLDAETYYSKEYSLTKLTTEAYIRDPRFQIIGVSTKVNSGPATWHSFATLQEYRELLAPLLEGNCLLCHNTAFDGAILGWRLGIHPPFMFDTLSMARPANQMSIGVSLKALSDKYTVGQKGTEVILALGKRLEDFTTEELYRYGEYCKNDVDLTYLLFHILRQDFPPAELRIIDLLLKMYTTPVLELDVPVLEAHLSHVQERKAAALETVNALCSKAGLMSNPKFADVLRGLGVEPPMKISPTTGKPAYAFSKTDAGFKELLEHDNPDVQAVVTARLGVKSTIEETRTLSFLDVATRGKLPVPLKYYGAHTGRVSAAEGSRLNMTNLTRGGELRRAVTAPEGHSLVVCDSSQIEARIVAWLAGEWGLVEAFARGEDIYSQFASKVYGRPVDRKRKEVGPDGKTFAPDEVEGFVGKTCVAEGTLLLCKHVDEVLYLPVEKFTPAYQLWDGEEWVWAAGLVSNGLKETLPLCGTWLTPDHLVLSGTQWKEAQHLEQDAGSLSRALEYAAVNLPSQGTSKAFEGESGSSLFSVVAGAQNIRSTYRASKRSRLPDAIYVQGKQQRAPESCIGVTPTLFPTTSTENAYSIGYPLQLAGATTKETAPINTTDVGASPCALSGELTEQHSFGTSLPCQDGMYPTTRWTELTATEGTCRAIFGSSLAARTYTTRERSETCKTESQGLRKKLPVYDVANAGPRNRFTILTSAGHLIVHNCILGLGFGMSHEKFALQLKTDKTPVIVSPEESMRIVSLYRNTYSMIRTLWKTCDKALLHIYKGEKFVFGANGVLETCAEGIKLPNGMIVRYPHLTMHKDQGALGVGFAYASDRRQLAAWTTMNLTNEWDLNKLTRIYGAKVTENVVQALARIVVMDQMVAISKRYRPVHTVYDDIAICVHDGEAEEAKAFMLDAMSVAPDWAPGLPIACEAGIGKNYADAK